MRLILELTSPQATSHDADRLAGAPQAPESRRATGVAESAPARYGCGMVSSPDAPSDLDPSSAGAAPVVVEDDVAGDPDAAAPASSGSGTASAASGEREVLGWLEFGEAARHLARDVVAADFTPDVIVAVARGGLVLAGAISYALDTKMCGSINVEFYTGVDERLPEPVLLPPTLDAPALAGKRVLVVDDVSDSGRTLALVRDLLAEVASEVRTVCLYSKPQTILEPDFTWKRTSQWITFPWSALPPVTRDAGQGDAS
jgi:hypoxanthine phosphoribosyltransferase